MQDQTGVLPHFDHMADLSDQLRLYAEYMKNTGSIVVKDLEIIRDMKLQERDAQDREHAIRMTRMDSQITAIDNMIAYYKGRPQQETALPSNVTILEPARKKQPAKLFGIF